MSEIPSEFFSKKTFQSLPKLAFLTWLFVFIIDAVILQRFPYTFIRVVYVWVIGFVISFLFELARYKNMDPIEKNDYRKYFLFLNAFIIFLYASSYTGLTKQVGAWGELQNTVNQNADPKNAKFVPKKTGIFLATVEWAIPVLANQTSYFPDVTAIAENNALKIDNENLTERVSKNPTFDSTGYLERIKMISLENTRLKEQLSKVKAPDCSAYLTEINRLQADLGTVRSQINVLVSRIQASNEIITRFNRLRQIPCIARIENSALRIFDDACRSNIKDVADYKSLLFNRTLIDIPK